MDPTSTLTDELRWFVRLRWICGLTIVLAVPVNALLTRWTPNHLAIMMIGAGILAYNAMFWAALDRRGTGAGVGAIGPWALAILQVVLDLVALTAITMRTGGLASPLLWLFVLHMVLASMLLPAIMAYGSALLAMGLVLASLPMLGMWPREPAALRLMLGWVMILLLTVYLTNHITANIRRKDRELRQQNRRIRAILDTAADGIISIGEDGVIRAVNPAAERIFGYEAKELIGRNVSLLMADPDASEHDHYIRRYLATGEARIIGIGREVEGRRQDGSVFPIELSIGEVRLERGERLFTGILRDVTDRKKAEQELRRLNEALQHHQRMLVQSEKMSAMGQMAAGVAHEVANPLASMDSLVQLVQRQPDRMSERTGDLLREQISRISRIVQQLTEFAHPNETGWETARLNPVVLAALDMLRFDHRLRAVELASNLDDDVGAVRCIPHAVQQVVVNLVMNAVDALEGADAPRLEVTTRRDGDWCVLEVSDNGHGIAPEDQGRVFEPFFTTKPVGRGTGLGLSITYSLVQQHDGQCEVHSAPGEGTRFSIRLPAAPSGDGADQAGTA